MVEQARANLLVSSLAGVAVVLISGLLGWVAISTTDLQKELAVVGEKIQSSRTTDDTRYNEHETQLRTIWPRLRDLEQEQKLLQQYHQ